MESKICRRCTKCSYVEDHQDADELSEAERDAEFEGCKCGNHGRPALFNDVRNAADVHVARGEGRRHRSLRHRQRNTGVGSLQRAAVIATITTHHNLTPIK